MFPALDGESAVDMATILVAFLAILIRPARRWVGKQKPYFNRQECTLDFLNGAVVVPFLMLLLSPFSKWVLDELVRSSKLPLSLAGGVGLFFVIGELFAGKKQPS